MNKIIRKRKISSKVYRIEQSNGVETEILGRFLRAFIHNADDYIFTEIEIYQDGKIDCHFGDLVDLDGLRQKINDKWIVTNIPDGSKISLYPFGSFIAEKAMFQIRGDEYIKEVADVIDELNDRKNSSQRCVDIYERYNKNPDDELRKKLKEAYYNVPEHNRHFLLGDMDRKDQAILDILEK